MGTLRVVESREVVGINLEKGNLILKFGAPLKVL